MHNYQKILLDLSNTQHQFSRQGVANEMKLFCLRPFSPSYLSISCSAFSHLSFHFSPPPRCQLSIDFFISEYICLNLSTKGIKMTIDLTRWIKVSVDTLTATQWGNKTTLYTKFTSKANIRSCPEEWSVKMLFPVEKNSFSVTKGFSRKISIFSKTI